MGRSAPGERMRHAVELAHGRSSDAVGPRDVPDLRWRVIHRYVRVA